MLTIQEVQQVETEILQEVHNYCKKNGLRYCMTYGTLIGAVRHHGFIPWDNDIDIYMPRPDYDKLIQMAQKEPIAPNLKVLYYGNDPKFHYMAARVVDTRTKATPSYLREVPENMGVWIDLFAVDGCWKHPFMHPVYWLGLNFNKLMQRAHTYYMPGKNTKKNKIMGILVKLFPSKNNHHQFKEDKWARKCPFEGSEKVTDITDWTRRDYSVYLTPEDFNEPVEMDFDGRKFLAPKDYDRFLRSYYGDYMQLPPEDQRETHDIEVEWRSDNQA